MDGLLQLDERLLVAPGERAADRRAPASSRRLRGRLRGALGRQAPSRRTGHVDPGRSQVGGAEVRAWFSPGRGEALSSASPSTRAGAPAHPHRVARAHLRPGAGHARRARRRGRIDLAGIVDDTQVDRVFQQWRANGDSLWKVPLLAAVLQAPFSGKPSTPWTPDPLHDFMHAKVTVADDAAFVGSFNLSRSGERNAENVLEIHDAALADRLAASWTRSARATRLPRRLREAPARRRAARRGAAGRPRSGAASPGRAALSRVPRDNPGTCAWIAAGGAGLRRGDRLHRAARPPARRLRLRPVGGQADRHPDHGRPRLPAKLRVRFEYAAESDRGPYPIPPGVRIEGGSDRHALIVDRDRCVLYELYASAAGSGWRAGSGAIWSLRSNRLRPAGWTSADAAGLPILPGLARYDEVARGRDRPCAPVHGRRTGARYVYPARHSRATSPIRRCRRWASACGSRRATPRGRSRVRRASCWRR